MCDLPKTTIVEHIFGAQTEACKVKLEKNSKGFNWELSMSGPDFVTCMKAVDEANEIMKSKYGVA
jgi:hypothetical protein